MLKRTWCGGWLMTVAVLLGGKADAATALFLGKEYQAGAGPNAGTVRVDQDPADDAAFAAFLATAAMGLGDVKSALDASAPKAVWGAVASASPGSIALGGTTVPVAIVGWSNATSAPTATTGTAAISGAGNNAGNLQSGSPRPDFASGVGSGYYIGTSGGGGGDGVRNAVSFDLSGFDGGGVYAFGLFGGDLETSTAGVLGFLRVLYADATFEDIFYAPDQSLADDAVFDENNNTSETYGNETSRFIGVSSDDKRIVAAIFVVGDDDLHGTGDDEQLSFIAPMTFLDATGKPYRPTAVPEAGGLTMGMAGVLMMARRKRRG
jgi:hypothetical protein